MSATPAQEPRGEPAFVGADRGEAGHDRVAPSRRRSGRRTSGRRPPGSRRRRSSPRVPRGSACPSPIARELRPAPGAACTGSTSRAARDARPARPGAARRTCTASTARMSASSPCRSSARCCAKCTPSTAASAPDGVDAADQLGGGRDRAHRVRRERERDQPRPIGERGVERVEVERDVVVADVDPAHGGARVLGREHPRPDVRVVVELRDDDLVAGPERAAERPREVQQQRRRVRPEHDLAGVGARDVGGGAAGLGDQRIGLLAGGERPVRVADPAPQMVRRSRRSPSPGPASRRARPRRRRAGRPRRSRASAGNRTAESGGISGVMAHSTPARTSAATSTGCETDGGPIPMRFGLDVTQHQLEWDEIVSRAKLAEDAGFDGVWVFDHFKALYADPKGPCLEGWTLLAGLARETTRVRLGDARHRHDAPDPVGPGGRGRDGRSPVGRARGVRRRRGVERARTSRARASRSRRCATGWTGSKRACR